MPHHLTKAQLWERMRQEAKADADAEPTLASFLYSSILGHATFEKSLNFILANKLASPTLYSTQLVKIIEDCYQADPAIVDAALADMQAVFDRDPACDKYTQCLLYFKGFQAIQCHRIAHYLWSRGRKVGGHCVDTLLAGSARTLPDYRKLSRVNWSWVEIKKPGRLSSRR
jgi:serine O-acetyltransferase